MSELSILLQHYKLANHFLTRSLSYFYKEKSTNCKSLITECIYISKLLKILLVIKSKFLKILLVITSKLLKNIIGNHI